LSRGIFTRRILTLLALLPAAMNASTQTSDLKPEPLSAFARSPLVIETRAGKHQFDVWIADSPARRAQGLMFVERLARGTGMLFIYDTPHPVSMWMKNTLIPLDMLFVAADGRVTRIARNTKPHSLESISSLGAVTWVLEIAGGECARLGIETGDRLSLLRPEP
jgi:uncharacterized protein